MSTGSSQPSASIRLSTEHKGRKRREPVWIARYRVKDKDSAKVLGKAWTKRSRPPAGYLTRGDAELEVQRLLASVAADVKATSGAPFAQVANEYVATLKARIRTGSFRPSTLRTYENIIQHDLLPLWAKRPIASITSAEIGTYHRALLDRSRAPPRPRLQSWDGAAGR